jgi:hypothetical protein
VIGERRPQFIHGRTITGDGHAEVHASPGEFMGE